MLNSEVRNILELYIVGKDENRFDIHENIYKPDARVSFEIKPDSISFPLEIIGNQEIAKILSADFNQKYDNVRTYYLSKQGGRIDELNISKQKWLVLMREKTSDSLRVGTGYYDWLFEKGSDSKIKIKHHHIFISEMLDLRDLSLNFLIDIQKRLSYPWLDQETAIEVLEKHNPLREVIKFLKSKC